MARRPSLTMGPVVQNTKEGEQITGPFAPPPALTAVKPASRIGKVQLGGYLSPEAKRQLDVFAAMNGRTMQSIFEEMIDDFSRKYGLHRLVGSDQS